ncbi:MAG: capsular biosynthesis protein [Gammaproteobacteria bacterium]|nr:capsular biosynthesis protein [Gammaproteobacteria bacterium]
MIDLHCHLLPGIDDGPEELAEAMELAKAAVENGIQRAVLTPHIHPGRYENDKARITRAVISFRQQLEYAGISLALGVGAEVRICPEIFPMVLQQRIPYLGRHQGKDVLLLELPHSHVPPGSDKMIDWLNGQGIQTLIAHPERNKEIMRSPDKIALFLGKGCLLQVTAASLAGGFGPQVQDCARYFLRQGWVHLLATDAHTLEYRPPDLIQGFHAAIPLIGEEAARRLVYDHPDAIASSQFVS